MDERKPPWGTWALIIAILEVYSIYDSKYSKYEEIGLRIEPLASFANVRIHRMV